MTSQYLPGTASLLEELDKRLMVLLRDGRTLIGYLRSVDQFANLVLHRCIERIHVGSDYGDIPRGVFIVRGENVVSKLTNCENMENRIAKNLDIRNVPSAYVLRQCNLIGITW